MSVTINHQTNSVEPSSGDLSIGGSGNVGIGTSSPAHSLSLEQSNKLGWVSTVGSDKSAIEFSGVDDSLRFYNNTGSTERMRLDSSGNLLVGTTDASLYNNGAGGAVGVGLNPSGYLQATRSNSNPLLLNRLDSDGNIADFRKNGVVVGSISAYSGDLVIGTGDTGLFFNDTSDHIKPVNSSNGANRDNAIDLGSAGSRWAVVRAGTGSINTSDRNEKQDIAELTDAEQRVAVACKSLIRKFKFNDAVEAKGDDARIHVGIIAQDLQAAFAAEGLDAGDYAMFCSDTWWETQTEVPAVDAVAEVLDDDGNVVTEPVEAVDAYTRTDTYDTQEEAPEGSTERTRLGVRYSELLAFIIAAI